MMTFFAFGALVGAIVIVSWAGVFVVISECAAFFAEHA
jgi:hypothetical protein